MTATRIIPKARPTNRDLQDQVGEVHNCLHDLGEAAAEDRRRAEDDRIKLAKLEGSVDLLVKYFGLRLPTNDNDPLPRRRLTFGGLEWWQAMATIVGGMAGSIGAWKFLWPALVALHHAILAH